MLALDIAACSGRGEIATRGHQGRCGSLREGCRRVTHRERCHAVRPHASAYPGRQSPGTSMSESGFVMQGSGFRVLGSELQGGHAGLGSKCWEQVLGPTSCPGACLGTAHAGRGLAMQGSEAAWQARLQRNGDRQPLRSPRDKTKCEGCRAWLLLQLGPAE